MSDHMLYSSVCVGSNKEHRVDANIIDTNLVLQTRKIHGLQIDLVVQTLDSAIQPIKSWSVDMSYYQGNALSLNSDLSNR